jgi:hypothetical protein
MQHTEDVPRNAIPIFEDATSVPKNTAAPEFGPGRLQFAQLELSI